MNITINFIPKTVSGYYESFNLDFEIRFEDEYSTETYSYDNIDEDFMEDFLNECIYQEPEKKGLFKIHSKQFLIKLEEMHNEGQEILESVFAQFTDQYGVAVQFSNGETFYSKSA